MSTTDDNSNTGDNDAADGEDDFDPKSVDGRVFGRKQPEENSVNIELLPDDLTEKQEQILTTAILNEDLGYADIHRRVVDVYYDGDTDEAPGYSYVYNTVKDFENDRDRPKSDYVRSSDADSGGEEESESSSDEEQTTISVGNKSYSGPSEGLNLADSVQYITDRPVKPGQDSVQDEADAGSTDSEALDFEGLDNHVVQVVDEDMVFSQDEILSLLECAASQDADRELLRKLARRVE